MLPEWESDEMRVRDLEPGMLLEPIEGHSWYEIPWRGVDGKFMAYYLHVEVDDHIDMTARTDKPSRKEPVLYLGTADDSSVIVTPGRQRVLAWGETRTVAPLSWKKIKGKHEKTSGEK